MKIESEWEKIMKYGVSIDMTEQLGNYKKELEKTQKDYGEKEKAEGEKMEKMECPCCKSIEKSRHITHNDNGIYGTGYHSTKVDDYFICKKCGVHYDNINKVDLGTLPGNSIFF